MAIQILGQDGTSVQAVDSTFKSARVTIRPYEVNSWLSVGATTGNTVTLAASSSIFSLRNLSANFLLIRRVTIAAVCSTAFTTAQRMAVDLCIARSFTVSDTGGTAISFTGNNGKHRTSLVTPTSVDCRISTTSALTAGTKTLDNNPISTVGFWVGGVGNSLVLTNLFSHDTGDYPLVLSQNEGINIRNVILMGATGVVVFDINIEFAESSSF